MCIYVTDCFFFFKQKTAYEMRISDWSSDVCSSDLPLERPRRRRQPGDRAVIERRRFARERPAIVERPATVALHLIEFERGIVDFAVRSEEHTSELQSLMRISYAVFCLKKKKSESKLKRINSKHQYAKTITTTS